ncbi:MAG: hypothetical protein KF838_14400 [Phycisphaeraceae bacterium]|nr:MAG: hypothetical protein KF838_14400 [Phycisphaeraceae bacterium]
MPRRLLAAIVVVAGLAVAPAAPAAPVTSAFTYQGEIQKSGSPVTGNADLRFTLWDAVSGGNQIGSQINRNNVAVSGGVFTVSLDFGIDALKTGQERYLQIELRSPAGSGAFVTLPARQPLSATPFATTALGGASPFVVHSSTNDAKIRFYPESFYQIELSSAAGNPTGGVFNNSNGSVFFANNATGVPVMYAGHSTDTSGFIELRASSGHLNVLIESESFDFAQSGLIRLSSSSPGNQGGIYQSTNNTGRLTYQLRGGVNDAGADLRLFDSGTGATSIQILGENELNVDGGAIRSLNQSGHAHISLEPDFSAGGGGYFSLVNPTFNSYIIMESNDGAQNSAQLLMAGASSAMALTTGNTGDDSVALPVNAINSTEILNEPGLAHNQAGNITITTTRTSVISRSITVPAPGYVLVLVNGDLAINHVTGSLSYVEWNIDDTAGGLGSAFDDMLFQIPSGAPSGTYDSGAGAHAVYSVPSAGTYTYHLNMVRFGGTATLFDVQFTVIYFPTAYGTVNPSITGDDFRGSPFLGNNGPTRMPQTAAEIAAERNQSRADDLARVQGELAQMRREMAELRAMMLQNPNVKAKKQDAVKAPAIINTPNITPVAQAPAQEAANEQR